MFPPSEAASARTPKDRCVCAERAVSSGDGGADTPVPPPAAPQRPWNCPYHACAPHSPAHRTGVRVRIAAQTARASTPGAGRSVSGGGTARRAWLDEHITPPPPRASLPTDRLSSRHALPRAPSPQSPSCVRDRAAACVRRAPRTRGERRARRELAVGSGDITQWPRRAPLRRAEHAHGPTCEPISA